MDKTSFAGKAVALASVAALTLLDQITKILAADRLADGPFVIIPACCRISGYSFWC